MRCRLTLPPSHGGSTAPRDPPSAVGKLLALGNRFFQIESLYRFNAKFFPRWEPRYLVYEGAL
jgi:lysyl-tRNA synthetase class 2